MDYRLPDFIIAGAMKSATSSLHQVLNTHPDIALPAGEGNFFDADDPVQNPHFFFLRRGELLSFDTSENGPLFRSYVSQYAPLAKFRWIGEDSPNYLFSSVAGERIKRMLPQARLIFILRDPVERAYSHYWHYVKTGRIATSFERALLEWPVIIQRSTYARRLENYHRLFGADRIQVHLFEDWLRDRKAVVDQVTDHIGAPRFDPPVQSGWANRTEYPTRPGMTLALNRVSRRIVEGRYYNYLGIRAAEPGAWRGKLYQLWRRRLLDRTLKGAKPPPMRATTRAFLTSHLAERNTGLGELLGRDLGEVWKGF